jgi:hypothetical protein
MQKIIVNNNCWQVLTIVKFGANLSTIIIKGKTRGQVNDTCTRHRTGLPC